VVSFGCPCRSQEQSTKAGKPYLNNHLRFKILYHQEPTGEHGSNPAPDPRPMLPPPAAPAPVVAVQASITSEDTVGYYGSRIVGFEVEAFRYVLLEVVALLLRDSL
jgi:hypothetical protein